MYYEHFWHDLATFLTKLKLNFRLFFNLPPTFMEFWLKSYPCLENFSAQNPPIWAAHTRTQIILSTSPGGLHLCFGKLSCPFKDKLFCVAGTQSFWMNGRHFRVLKTNLYLRLAAGKHLVVVFLFDLQNAGKHCHTTAYLDKQALLRTILFVSRKTYDLLAETIWNNVFRVARVAVFNKNSFNFVQFRIRPNIRANHKFRVLMRLIFLCFGKSNLNVIEAANNWFPV